LSLPEGDHIKVTASKFPFPTVCADNQSIDWFHAISRTLKWNERERQKSFVVVEEGPAKSKARKPNKLAQSIVPDNAIEQPKKSPDSVDEAVEDDDEDEVSEEEDDKFDIDDSSPEAATLTNTTSLENRQTPEEEALGMEKTREQAWADPQATPAAAAAALHDGNAYMRAVKAKSKSKSRSRERSRHRSNSQSGDSGVDTPGRFAGPAPHPPRISHRHIEFADPLSVSPSSFSTMTHPEHHGTRDDINTQKSAGQSSGKSRIPRDRDVDAESSNMKTPTVADVMHGGGKRTHHRGHSPEQEHHHHRAFAVWGQDESDSNASDSDV
jgi:NAD+ kinase